MITKFTLCLCKGVDCNCLDDIGTDTLLMDQVSIGKLDTRHTPKMLRLILEDATRTVLLTQDKNVVETGSSLSCWLNVRRDGRDLDQSVLRRAQTLLGWSGGKPYKSVHR